MDSSPPRRASKPAAANMRHKKTRCAAIGKTGHRCHRNGKHVARMCKQHLDLLKKEGILDDGHAAFPARSDHGFHPNDAAQEFAPSVFGFIPGLHDAPAATATRGPSSPMPRAPSPEEPVDAMAIAVGIDHDEIRLRPRADGEVPTLAARHATDPFAFDAEGSTNAPNAPAHARTSWREAPSRAPLEAHEERATRVVYVDRNVGRRVVTHGGHLTMPARGPAAEGDEDGSPVSSMLGALDLIGMPRHVASPDDRKQAPTRPTHEGASAGTGVAAQRTHPSAGTPTTDATPVDGHVALASHEPKQPAKRERTTRRRTQWVRMEPRGHSTIRVRGRRRAAR